ncbi:MAG: sodium-dependent transporter [Alphaproteobacteria bacterium]|nr:sodium-dependent transporter [Alphaproteobacteria bacterium]
MSVREEWGSHHGFTLAAIGSAVGLGNMWRFSYVAGENGGAVFVLIYLACVALIGLPLIIAELSIGRRGQGDAVAAFSTDGRGWPAVGWLCIVGASVILSYYAVIAGWALKYFTGAATGILWENGTAGYGSYFERFIGNLAEPVLWQGLMLGATVVVVAGGIKGGIELFNRWLMPLLALIVCGLAVYALSLPNSGGGVDFLFSPDWSALGRPQVYVAALGQAFFSLGVGMAIFATYGSYMPRDFSLPACAAVTVTGDTLFAIIAGLAIFPGVFAFGVDPAAGPKLAFITLPQIFMQMPGGLLIGAVFFFLLSAAALTSMVSLLEVPVAMAIHRFGWRRKATAWGTGALVFLIGVPSALSFGVLKHVTIAGRGILEAIDAAVSNLLLPTGGILIALFVGWHVKRATTLDSADLARSRFGASWLWLLRTAVPAAVLLILLHSAGLI